MKKTLKLVASLLVIIILLIVLTLAVLFLNPKLVLTAFNSLQSDYNATAEHVALHYFPPYIELEEFSLTQQDNTLATVNSLSLQGDWSALIDQNAAHLHDAHLQLSAHSGVVDLQHWLTSSNQTEHKPSDQPTRLNLSALLKPFSVDISDIQFIFDHASRLDIAHLNTRSVEHTSLGMNLGAEYSSGTQSVFIDASADVSDAENQNQLSLSIQELDLSQFLHAQTAEPQVSRDTAGSGSEGVGESSMDWSWIQSLAPTTLRFKLGALITPEARLSDLVGTVAVTERLIIKVSSDIEIALNEAAPLKDRLVLNADLKPLAVTTSGADAQGLVSLTSQFGKASANGIFNLNGTVANDFALELNAERLPKPLALDDYAQFMPVALTSRVSSDSSSIELRELSGQFGESNLAGQISFRQANESPPNIDFRLTSNKFQYAPPQPELSQEPIKEPIKEPSNKAAKFFSTANIDWSWMSLFALNGELLLEQLFYDRSELNNVRVPIKLNAQGLSIDEFSSTLNKGAVLGSLHLRPDNSNVAADFNLTLKQVNMAESGLFSDGQIEGGVSNVDFQLSLNGNSIAELASSSKGHLLADIGEGKIAQDSFEIIGSDLILGLISKLNPFSKSDPSTKLKCAVVNLDIADGLVKAKKSIAIETSKLAIVGNGKIDLNKETIDLSFSPKPKNTVGTNLSSLASIVKLGGTLTNPKPVVSASGLASSGLSVGAAVSTGGLSLLAEGLLDDVTADDACNKARSAFKP